MSESSGHKQSFISRYIFSRDHKVIGTQFLFSTLIWMIAGGGLAILLRIQLAWPWTDVPYFGNELFASEGGQISPDFYNMLFTMHASIMIFFVIIPILAATGPVRPASPLVAVAVTQKSISKGQPPPAPLCGGWFLGGHR